MSWELVTVTVAAIAGFVALVKVTLPYLVARTEVQRKLAALDQVNKRLDVVESRLAGPRLPVGLPGRRTA